MLFIRGKTRRRNDSFGHETVNRATLRIGLSVICRPVNGKNEHLSPHPNPLPAREGTISSHATTRNSGLTVSPLNSVADASQPRGDRRLTETVAKAAGVSEASVKRALATERALQELSLGSPRRLLLERCMESTSGSWLS
jgi:hypothetical protein